MRRAIRFTALILGVVLTASACGMKATEPFRDSPRSSYTNSDGADVIEMPDGFNNLATKYDAMFTLPEGQAPVR